MTKRTGELNRVEVWVAERAVPIFAALAVLIVIGAGAVFWNYQKQGATQRQVDVLKPQVTQIVKAAATCDAKSLHDRGQSKICAERIRIGLLNCRRVPVCRAALLAAIAGPPPARLDAHPALPNRPPSSSGGGDAFQPSSHGHQPPGPAQGPSPSPSPSPAPAPVPAPSPSRVPESPGNGAQGSPGGGSSSGPGVEVCALERCVGAEVDLNPKGLLP